MRPQTIVVATVATLLKIWLLAQGTILPIYNPFDSFNFISHAKAILDGHWLGAYTNLTLVKGPVYSLFIAASAALHVPLLRAEELLYAFSCLLFVLAVGPLIKGRWDGAILMCALLFNPFSLSNELYVVNRGAISPSFALMSVACMAALVVRRHGFVARLIPWATALGVSLAAFSLTREEYIWLTPALVCLALVFVFVSRPLTRSDAARRAAIMALPAALVVGTNLIVDGINWRQYGWFTAVEFQSTQFLSAYGSLVRVEHTDDSVLYPVPVESRRYIYAVSPAFRRLRPYLEGDLGRAWRVTSCSAGDCADIGGGWFVWAFRDSVADAGYYRDGQHAASFYTTLAHEIDSACTRTLLHCWHKTASLSPHLTFTLVPVILQHAQLGLTKLLLFEDIPLSQQPLPSPPLAVVDIYRSVTLEQMLVAGDSQHLTGPTGVRLATARQIENLYQVLVAPFSVIGAFFVIARVVWMMARRRAEDYTLLMISLAASGATLIMILSIIDVTSFDGFSPEYLAPLYPFAIVFATLPLMIELRRLTTHNAGSLAEQKRVRTLRIRSR